MYQINQIILYYLIAAVFAIKAQCIIVIMVLNGLLDVSCAAELQFNEAFSQQLVELFKHSATDWYAGPCARSPHFSALGQHEQSSQNLLKWMYNCSHENRRERKVKKVKSFTRHGHSQAV